MIYHDNIAFVKDFNDNHDVSTCSCCGEERKGRVVRIVEVCKMFFTLVILMVFVKIDNLIKILEPCHQL